MAREFKKEQIKIAAFDLDGTILCTQSLSPYTVKILKKMRQDGILLSVATGRGIIQVDPEIRELFDYAVTCNGGAAGKIGGKRISGSPMSFEALIRARRVAALYGGISLLVADDIILTTKSGLDLYRCKFAAFMGDSYADEAALTLKVVESPVAYAKRNKLDIFKVNFFFPTEKQRDDALAALGKLTGFYMVPDYFECIELTAPGIDKGLALKALLKETGFKEENLIAFGDNYNDTQMLSMAAYSIAPEGAQQCAKDSAATICGPAEQDGIAKAIANLFGYL